MTHEILISGFGGQGVMAMGKTLTEAGLKAGFNVSWLPSYGPEMRGGTANCSVVISDEPVSSPIVLEATEIVVMNKPSLLKYESSLVSGGTLFINSSVVAETATRTDIRVIRVPANDIAQELGNTKCSNMVMLGAFVAATRCVDPEILREMIHETFTGAKAKLVPLNEAALARGIQCVKAD